jgi:TRAP-type C4-dicarboxylate transport system substrate-binding protein
MKCLLIADRIPDVNASKGAGLIRIQQGLFGAVVLFVLSSAALAAAAEKPILTARTDAPIELKMSHFCPTTWVMQADVLEPWTKKIEALTEGRVKFTIFPKETLGKASELYDFAVQGKTDIALSITEYTPGRFPLSSCMELPFLGAKSAEEASLVYWRLYQKYLQDEFKETRVLWTYCNGLGQLHTTTKQVKTLDDLKGLKIRVSDPLLAKVMQLLGAEPVICSVLEGYDLFKEGKLDGCIVPWDGLTAFKYLEFCKSHTEINLYVLPCYAVMNKEKYESLPPDIKKIIDENTGEEMASLSGKAMNRAVAKSRKLAEERGDFIYSLPEPEFEKWKKIVMPVGDEWIGKMQARGLPGQEVLGYVIDLYDQIQKQPVHEEPIELKISHFGLSNWIQHTAILDLWAKKIENLSKGRVKCTFYTNETLGKADQQYDLTVRGTADISCSITEYTPGRFPVSSVMSLPFLGVHNSEGASLVYWRLYQKYLIDKEFKDVKVLWLFCHGLGQIHTINKPVRTIEDLKGLKLRVGDSSLGKALELLGAIPIVSTVNEGQVLLKEGKIDGIVIPWDAIYSFGYFDLCRYHTEIDMYTLPFFVVMNKEKYESLPADIKQIIDENSGESWSVMAGKAMDNEDIKIIEKARARGDAYYVLPAAQLEQWKNITMPVGDGWVREMKAKGLPSQEIITYVNESLVYVNGLLNPVQK